MHEYRTNTESWLGIEVWGRFVCECVCFYLCFPQHSTRKLIYCIRISFVQLDSNMSHNDNPFADFYSLLAHFVSMWVGWLIFFMMCTFFNVQLFHLYIHFNGKDTQTARHCRWMFFFLTEIIKCDKVGGCRCCFSFLSSSLLLLYIPSAYTYTAHSTINFDRLVALKWV